MSEEISLVQFLTDLREDLTLARRQAVTDAAKNVAAGEAALWFGVDEVTVTLEIEHASVASGKISTEAEAKFWVFASAKAGGEVGHERSRRATQTLTLTLKPRFDEVIENPDGTTTIKSTGVSITGASLVGER